MEREPAGACRECGAEDSSGIRFFLLENRKVAGACRECGAEDSSGIRFFLPENRKVAGACSFSAFMEEMT